MIKVVEFLGEPLNYGGQEAFIYNVYSNINKENFKFTFITPFECQNTKLQDEIKKNKDELIYDNKKFESKLRKKYIIETANKYLNGKYDVIHIHSGSIFTLYNVAKIAKKKGFKKVIVHSHVAGKNNLKYKIIKFISDLKIDKYVDYYFACSDLAGRGKYPKRIISTDKYYVINNGIDLNKFAYSPQNRESYRKKFNLRDEKVIIHVGRFATEKNHKYILKIFMEILKKEKNSRLFLVGGTGDTYNLIKEEITNNKLDDYISILLNRGDVENLINMSDVFILPSLWEGLPFTGIEAQANGIPCIFSDKITNELNISASYNKLSIDDDPKDWASKILSLCANSRINTLNDIKKNGFDIQDVCDFLSKVYGDGNGKN